jgi:hypothetical protein
VDSANTRRFKKKAITRLQPVSFGASYDPSTRAVTLTIQGKPSFAQGGQIRVSAAPPSGVKSADGLLLDTIDSVFTILPKARGITPG